MPDIGWSELLLIAVIAIVVVGPRELPDLMRKFAKFSTAARRAAHEFRASFEEFAREAEYEETRRQLKSVQTETMTGLINPVTGDVMRPSALPDEQDYEPPDESETAVPSPPTTKA